MAKKRAYLGKNNLLDFSKKRIVLEVILKHGEESFDLKLRALTARENNELETFASKIVHGDGKKHDGVGVFQCLLTRMMLNADESQMFDSVEEGLDFLLTQDQNIVSQLIPHVRFLTFGETALLKKDETPEEAKERKVEEVAKNSETAPVASV